MSTSNAGEQTQHHHVLPGEDGDSSWLARLNDFERQETRRQVKFKRDHWPRLQDGVWSKRPSETYPHILPEGHLKKGLFPVMADAVIDYCAQEAIAIHSEALNLRSSQVACFNVMFPLRLDLDLARRVLAPLLPGVQRVLSIDFEYTGNDGATLWLGEPAGGKRGQNRTSIDVAIKWDEGKQKILTLVEWKYTERGYGACGGATSVGNKDKIACTQLHLTSSEDRKRCYLTLSRQHRHYWDHMVEAGINLERLEKMRPGCPFRGPFYQLMRQFQLAAYLRRPDAGEKVDVVEVVSVAFRGNTSLLDPGPYAALGSTITEAWNSALHAGVPPLRHVAVEQIADAIKADGAANATELAGYLSERYGL